MTEALAVQQVLDPTTGEVLALDSPSDKLASWLTEAREWESRLRVAKQMVADELTRRMDQTAAWTLRSGDFVIRGQSPDRKDWDAIALRKALKALYDEGIITDDAVEGAVEKVQSLKVRASGVKALHKLGGEVAEAIDSCEVEVTTPRRVSVSRK